MKLDGGLLPLTCGGRNPIIERVSARSAAQRSLGGLMVAALMGALFLPPAHIHLAGEDHDHANTPVEHSHWAPHQHASRVAFDDDDGRVLFIDHPAIARVAHGHGVRPHVAVVALLALITPIDYSGIASRTGGNAVRAGPALPAFHLRGPPIVL